MKNEHSFESYMCQRTHPLPLMEFKESIFLMVVLKAFSLEDLLSHQL